MKSIRGLVTRWLVAGFALLLLATGGAIYHFTKRALESEFNHSLEATALGLAGQVEQNARGLHMERSPQMEAAFGANSTNQCFEIWTADGQPATRSANLQHTDLSRPGALAASPSFWNLPLPMGGAGRAVGFTFRPKVEDEDQTQAPPGEAAIIVVGNRHPLDRTLMILATVLIASGVAAIAAAVSLVYVSLKRGLAPLHELGLQAARISSHDPQAHFPVAGLPNELQPIAQRLNELLARLGASFERERQFSADLAHELRTPLAELRTQAEVWLQGSDGEALEAHRETLAIAVQMQNLVGQLLELSRHQSACAPVATERLRLAELIHASWLPHAQLAAQRGVRIEFTIPSDIEVTANRALLGSILNNLFANAAAYTPQGGLIEVVCARETSTIVVANTVDDIGPDDLPHLFERLWRKEQSRTDHRHNGLGLALARSFATAMGWTLAASLEPKSRLVMTLADNGSDRRKSAHVK